jgi:hypothetical protein
MTISNIPAGAVATVGGSSVTVNDGFLLFKSYAEGVFSVQVKAPTYKTETIRIEAADIAPVSLFAPVVSFALDYSETQDQATHSLVVSRTGNSTIGLTAEVSIDASSLGKHPGNFTYAGAPAPYVLTWAQGDNADKFIPLTGITAPDGARTVLFNLAVTSGNEAVNIAQHQYKILANTV